MFRILLVVLFGLLNSPSAAKAQDYFVASDYFLVCLKGTDMFVLMHTWKFYGYDEFLKALNYYVLEKHYDGDQACGELNGILGPNANGETTTFILEEDFPFEDGESLRMYLWLSTTPEGVFTVLSTTLPLE